MEGLESRRLFAEISGVLFNDANGDGVWQSQAEAPLMGRQVFIDANADGAVSENEQVVVTDSQGRYTLRNLSSSPVRLAQVLPDGWKATRPTFQASDDHTTSPYVTVGETAAHFGSVAANNTFTGHTGYSGDGRVLSAASSGPSQFFNDILVTQVHENGVWVRDELRFYGANGRPATGDLSKDIVLTVPPGQAQFVRPHGPHRFAVIGRDFDTGKLTARSYSRYISDIEKNAPGQDLLAGASVDAPVWITDVVGDEGFDLYVTGRFVHRDGNPQERCILKFDYSGLDTTFASGGIYTEPVPDAERELSAPQLINETDYRVFWVANGFDLTRRTTQGTADLTFGDNGTTRLTYGGASVEISNLYVDPISFEIAVTGLAGSTPVLARLDASGALDTTFGDGGFATLPESALQARGYRNVRFTYGSGSSYSGYAVGGRVESVSNFGDAFVAYFDRNGQLQTDMADGGMGSFNVTGYDETIVGSSRYGWAVSGGNRAGVFKAAVPDVQINPRPVTIDADGKIRLSATAVDNGSPVRSWEWNVIAGYRNNAPDQPMVDFTGQNITFDAYQWLQSGYNSVQLRVRNANGFYGYQDQSIYVDRLLTNEAVAGSPTTVSFASAVTSPAAARVMRLAAAGDASLRYSFDFNNDGDFTDAGDVMNSDAASASHTFAQAGTYGVRARITDADNQSTDFLASVSVKATTTPTPTVVELAKGKPATASSSNSSTRTAAMAFDGNASTRWAASSGDTAAWVQVDLGQVSTITGVTLNWEYGYAKGYKLQTSLDGKSWSDAFATTTGDGKTDEIKNLTASGRFVRLQTTQRGTSYSVSLYDMSVFGHAGNPNPNPNPNPQPTTATIRGYAFNDLNADGVKNGSDQLTGGKVVFLDANNDGKLSAGEQQTTTASDGSFAFNGLAAGTYRVRRVFPSGYTYSTPLADITLSSGQQVSNVALGSKPGSTPPTNPNPNPTPTTGSISGVAFNDLDKDGVLDAADQKTGGKTVFLDANNNGKLDAGEKQVVTAADGSFKFDGLVAGTYRVRRVFPSGFTYSTKLIDLTLTAGQNVTDTLIGSKPA